MGRHCDKGDARQLLFGARQAQAVERDLGQPRPKWAGSGYEETDAALRVQGSLEILHFAEYRGNATRHFSSPASPAAGLAELHDRHSIDFLRESRDLAIQFRQKHGLQAPSFFPPP
jgi:hypothetical protein